MFNARRRPTTTRYRHLRMEPLEARTMLAITVSVDALGPTILVVLGDFANDSIAVTSDAGLVKVNGNVVMYGTPAQSLRADEVAEIEISGNAGNDTIDLTGVDAGFILLSETATKIQVHCGTDLDTFNGSRFAELVQGGDDEDHLYGNGGDDKLLGQNHIDVIWGGIGNDILTVV